MKNNYPTNVCNEVVEILEHIPKTLYDELPKEIVNYFYQNSDGNKTFRYNVSLPILEQNFSQQTKEIILFLTRVFWKNKIQWMVD